MRLTLRNVGYMCRLGLSTFLCEGAIAMMMFAGNYVFIRYLGEDGVAAFSIACYFFPYHLHGLQRHRAVGPADFELQFRCGKRRARAQGLPVGAPDGRGGGLGFFGLTALFSRWIVAMFIDSSALPSAIAVRGLPLFASGFVFFAVEHRPIGYFKASTARPAMAVTVLRGFVFMAACFSVCPAVGCGGHLAGRAAGRGASPSRSLRDLRADPLKKCVLGRVAAWLCR